MYTEVRSALYRATSGHYYMIFFFFLYGLTAIYAKWQFWNYFLAQIDRTALLLALSDCYFYIWPTHIWNTSCCGITRWTHLVCQCGYIVVPAKSACGLLPKYPSIWCHNPFFFFFASILYFSLSYSLCVAWKRTNSCCYRFYYVYQHLCTSWIWREREKKKLIISTVSNYTYIWLIDWLKYAFLQDLSLS